MVQPGTTAPSLTHPLRRFGTVATTLLALVAVVVAARFSQLAVWFLIAPTEAPALDNTSQSRVVRLVKTVPPLVSGNPERVEEEFLLTNPTAEPMTVRCIRSSCGCGDAVIDRQRIEPGETATLKLSVRTAGKSGAIGVMCLVDMEQEFAWECLVKLTIKPMEWPLPNDDSK